MTHLITVDDLDEHALDQVLARAQGLIAGASKSTPGPVVATLCLSASMRTSVGFQVAAARLGGSGVVVDGLRVDGAMSAAESLSDALRVLAGMADVVVVRAPVRLGEMLSDDLRAPVVNAGDMVEHPTQALIDFASLERFRGPVGSLRVALCGDLRMRSATSLLRLFRRRPPGSLVLVYPDDRGPVDPLDRPYERRQPEELDEVDALMMIGLPPGRGAESLDDAQRAAYALGPTGLSRLPADAIVLSPMPMIDELSAQARLDPRLRMFDQSDHGVAVRMAVLEHVLGRLG